MTETVRPLAVGDRIVRLADERVFRIRNIDFDLSSFLAVDEGGAVWRGVIEDLAWGQTFLTEEAWQNQKPTPSSGYISEDLSTEPTTEEATDVPGSQPFISSDWDEFNDDVEQAFDKAREKYSIEHDDQEGLEHLLETAFNYIADGERVKAGVLILSAQAYLARHEHKDHMQEGINAFMRACGQEVKAYPSIPTDEIVSLRKQLIHEEVYGENELFESMNKGDLVGIADGIADVLYVVIGTASAYGINIRPVFDEVQRSNMTKAVWDNETQEYVVIRSESGKVLKPETFSPAQLENVIEAQISRGERAARAEARRLWDEAESKDDDVIVAEIIDDED